MTHSTATINRPARIDSVFDVSYSAPMKEFKVWVFHVAGVENTGELRKICPNMCAARDLRRKSDWVTFYESLRDDLSVDWTVDDVRAHDAIFAEDVSIAPESLESAADRLTKAMDAADAVIREHGGTVAAPVEGWNAAVMSPVQLELFDVDGFVESWIDSVFSREEALEPLEVQLPLFDFEASRDLTGWERIENQSYEQLVHDCYAFGLIESTHLSMDRGDLIVLLWDN